MLNISLAFIGIITSFSVILLFVMLREFHQLTHSRSTILGHYGDEKKQVRFGKTTLIVLYVLITLLLSIGGTIYAFFLFTS